MSKRELSSFHRSPGFSGDTQRPFLAKVSNQTARLKVPIICVALWVIASAWFHSSPPGPRLWNSGPISQSVTQDEFTWESITPQTSLHYVPCYGSFQCARLLVPLNWNSSTAEKQDGPHAAVAVIKLPAKVPVTDPRYGGPVILNPGGPGESGVYQAITDGQQIQKVLDDPANPNAQQPGLESGLYFDIISFDPRGVNNTTPKLSCFANAFDQEAWLLSLPDYGLLWHSDSIIGLEWARTAALGASCSHGEDDTGILKHLNTAQTVEDMLRIVEKHAEWTAKEARRLLSCPRGVSVSRAQEVMDRITTQPWNDKIQYWGMSYGTLLGATFAAMHPDRVARMILDGVVDPADHYKGSWLTQLQDSDKIISKFCEYCFEAGPDVCHLHTGTSPADVEARFTSILLSLKENPIPMPPALADAGDSSPAFVTYGNAHLSLLSSMYFPFAVAEDFFELLFAIESRNTSSPPLMRLLSNKQRALGKAGGTKADGPSPYVSGFGSFQAISCMDGGGPDNMTRDDFNEYLKILEGQGRWISPSWARNKLSCLGHTMKPAWRPSMTFEKQEWENTSHPLLIISNTHDTVTPLRNARRVSTLFPGSVVLQQDSQGHCSHSNPSVCTAKAVRKYFQTGVLPLEGTICEPATRPFIGCTGEDGDVRGDCKFESGEEARLYNIMVELADPFGLKPKNE